MKTHLVKDLSFRIQANGYIKKSLELLPIDFITVGIHTKATPQKSLKDSKGREFIFYDSSLFALAIPGTPTRYFKLNRFN